MYKNHSKNFVSVVILSFPSRIQYDLWYEKYTTFYSSKAIQFLKDNGQLSQSANLIEEENDLIRVSLIWIYKDKKAFEKHLVIVVIKYGGLAKIFIFFWSC